MPELAGASTSRKSTSLDDSQKVPIQKSRAAALSRKEAARRRNPLGCEDADASMEEWQCNLENTSDSYAEQNAFLDPPVKPTVAGAGANEGSSSTGIFSPEEAYAGQHRGMAVKPWHLGLGYYRDPAFTSKHRYDGGKDGMASKTGPLVLGYYMEVKFTSVAKYAGHRSGMVSKKGHEGLGYYPGQLVTTSLQHEDRTVIKVSLEDGLKEMTGQSGGVTCNNAAEHQAAEKNGRRSKLSEEMAKTDSRLWKQDSMVSKADLSHSQSELWAVDTINPNCWRMAADYVACSGAYAVCIQETRLPEGPRLVDAVAEVAQEKWKLTIGACHATQAGGSSAGGATAICDHMGSCEGESKAMQTSKHLCKRFKLCLWGAVAMGGGGICTICKDSGVGLKSGPNLDLLQEVAAVLLPWRERGSSEAALTPHQPNSSRRIG